MKKVTEPEATRRLNPTVQGCLLVTAFLYAAAVLNVIVPRLGYSVQGVAHFAVLTALTALAVTAYLQCVFCDPGRVPPGWQPDAEQQAAAVLQVKRRGGGLRYCKKCAAYKPPRAHHCRRCGCCILRMDHHCTWTNNCIGHGNYRAFLLMCLHLAAACLHALGLLLSMDARLVQIALGWDEASLLAAAAGGRGSGGSGSSGGGDADSAHLGAAQGEAAGLPSLATKTGWRGPLWLHATAQVLGTALGLPVAVGLLVLLIWNLYLAARNQTTIEYHEGVVARHMAPRPGSAGSGGHPFDLGVHDNAAAVCGDSAACWLLPGRAAAQGDGLTFPSRWDAARPAGPGVAGT
ncbi:hypothetical protein ABPG75_013954 [Micractinium tetrahymenae]